MKNNNNFDINQMLSILSKMDKKQLEDGIYKANKILQSKSKEEILSNINQYNKK